MSGLIAGAIASTAAGSIHTPRGFPLTSGTKARRADLVRRVVHRKRKRPKGHPLGSVLGKKEDAMSEQFLWPILSVVAPLVIASVVAFVLLNGQDGHSDRKH